MSGADEPNIKFWLENHEVSGSAHDQPAEKISVARFSLPLAVKASCIAWMEANHVKPEVLFNMIFGLLCNRYIASNFITYAYGEGCKSKNTIHFTHDILVVSSNINEKTTVKKYLKTTTEQLTKENSLNDVNAARYLLLKKTEQSSNKKSLKSIAINQYPLILLFDSQKVQSLIFYYNEKYLGLHSIQLLFDHLVELLKSFCAPTAKYVAKLSILTEDERSRYYNQLTSADDHATFAMTRSVGDIFGETAKLFPNEIAVYHRNDILSYKELDELSTIVAKYLVKKHVNVSDIVAVYSERNVLLIIYMLAIFKVGAVFLPISAKYPSERIEYVLTDADPKIILTDQDFHVSSAFQERCLQISSMEAIKALADQVTNLLLPTIDSRHLAYIIYTSGSTGAPKGVMLEHRGLINLTNWYIKIFSISAKDRASQFASQGFDTFFCETIPFLLIGASVHIVDDKIKLTPTSFFEWLGDHQITICDVPTAYAKILFSLQWPVSLSLKIVKIGGESINRYPEHIYSFDIWNTYGPSEATIESTYKKIYEAYSVQTDATRSLIPSIGKPLHNTSIWVVDQNNQLVPTGDVGELLLGGVHLARGYLNKPELTEKKFIPNPFVDNPDERVYRTGDLVKLLPNGDLEYVGRVDDQVKIRGFRIELGEIESIISQYPDVRNVAVVVKEAYGHEKQICAYLVPDMDRQRLIFQEQCLLSVKSRYVETLTENISKGGLRLSSVNDPCAVGDAITVTLRLPGMSAERSLRGHIIWKQHDQCGIAFDLNDAEQDMVNKSIQFYLSTKNTRELITRSAVKRNIKTILKKKLPEYMLPTTVITMLDMPLTLSGKVDKRSLPDPEQFAQQDRDLIKPSTEKEQKLYEIWCDLLHKDAISLADSFFDLGGNSLLVAELSIRILETFGTLIPVNVLFDLPYLSIQAEYLETGGSQYNTQSHVQELIRQDLILSEHISSSGALSPHLASPKNILLTGAGGFLGVFLLKALLAETSATIYCIVRQGDFETPAGRLMEVVKKFSLQKYIDLANRRIVILGGDLSLEHFGLPNTLYESLVKKIDLIYHCGAQVNTMATYDVMRGSNVFGTVEIIKFATREVDKPIHYVSTLSSAYQKNELGLYHEVFPTSQSNNLSGGYALSKWVAECLLTEVSRRGLPVSIYRCGYISGWSETGVTNLNDGLLLFIKGCIQLGVAPEIHETLNLLPVDFVSEALVSISLKFPAKTIVYHVDHPIGVTWLHLIEWVNRYGYTVELIPLLRWQKLLSMISKENSLYPLLPFYLTLKEGDLTQLVDTSNFIAALTACDMKCPELNSELLSLYFNFLRAVNFLPIPVIEPTRESSQ